MSNSNNNPERLKPKSDPYIHEAAVSRLSEAPEATNWLIAVANIVDPIAVQAPQAPVPVYEQPAQPIQMAAMGGETIAATGASMGQYENVIPLRTETEPDAEAMKQLNYLEALREVNDAHNEGEPPYAAAA